MSVFYVPILLMINFVKTLSKFVVDPLATQEFDNVMTQFTIKEDRCKKTDINLLNCNNKRQINAPIILSFHTQQHHS